MMEATREFDLVVVGAGYAGLVAANHARQLGRTVAVLERGEDESYPCNSRVAGGVLHISYQNLNDPPEDLAAAALEITQGAADPTLVRALAENALRVVRWLVEEGAEYAGVGNSGWRQFILAPPRPPVTRMDWKGFGADVTLSKLADNFVRRGGELHRGARATHLTMTFGRCTGVEVERAVGGTMLYRASNVLLADGGFQGNSELIAKYISSAPGKLKQRCTLSGSGDGLRMAQEAGAATVGLEAFYGHLLARKAMTDDELWPYPQIDTLAQAGIMVDAGGKRFADEGLGGVYLSNAVARLADPASATVVFDEVAWQGPGRSSAIPPNPVLVTNAGTLHQAQTLHALAETIGVAPHVLEQTVAQYNRALAEDRVNALDPQRSAKRYAALPIVQAPFYAAPVCAGITYTMGGIAIDADARVLREDKSILPGLYAAGSTTGGLDGGPACGYVGGLIKAMVFGMLAAEHVGKQ
jgi:fumarate reductase flavoprotein subunit